MVAFLFTEWKPKVMKSFSLLVAACIIVALGSCDKRSHPAGSASVTRLDKNSGKKNSPTDAATVKATTKKLPTPKVLIVNDSAAKRTPDGRYYYDFNGKRYWRNKKDGKYYQFNKSMYNDEAFKGVKP